jgi:signal transduction histidine kinase
MLSVNDTGVGMRKSEIDKLFKISEKIGSPGTDGEMSTGLGLLLCKEFVEKNGGKIWVESKENIGSTFYFTLPKVN